jgi:hypothetical protein
MVNSNLKEENIMRYKIDSTSGLYGLELLNTYPKLRNYFPQFTEKNLTIEVNNMREFRRLTDNMKFDVEHYGATGRCIGIILQHNIQHFGEIDEYLLHICD